MVFYETLRTTLKVYWISYFKAKERKMNVGELKRTIKHVFNVLGFCLFAGKKPVPFPIVRVIPNEAKDGYLFFIRIFNGFSFADVEKKLPEIVNALQCEIKISNKYNMLMLEVFPERAMPSVLYYSEGEIRNLTEGTWKVVIGVNDRGRYITHDFEHIVHTLIAGATDMGKSSIVQQVVTTLLINHDEDEMQLAMIDLKGKLSALKFAGIRQLLPDGISGDLEETEALLDRLYELHKDRESLFLKHNCENIQEYERETKTKLSRIFIIVDEIAELSEGSKNEKELRETCKHKLSQLARLARATGFRIIVATQRPDANVLDPQVKQNLLGRIAFKCGSQTNSNIILDSPTAAFLPDIKGRLVYKYGHTETVLQSPYLDNNSAKIKLQRFKGPRQPSYMEIYRQAKQINEEVTTSSPSDVVDLSKIGKGDDDLEH